MASFLDKVEDYAYNVTLELNERYGVSDKVPLYPDLYDNKVAIKDIFNMVTAISASSFIAVGLTIPSPENASEPAYFAKDLEQLYNMK